MYRVNLCCYDNPVFTVKLSRAKLLVELVLLREYSDHFDHILWTWSWDDHLYRAFSVFPDGHKFVVAFVRNETPSRARKNNVIQFPSGGKSSIGKSLP